MTQPIEDLARSEINEALFRGEKIQAIRLYRQATGTGLADAKAAIERIETELRIQSPGNYQHAPSAPVPTGIGCMMLVMAVIVAAFSVNWFLADRSDAALRLRHQNVFFQLTSVWMAVMGCSMAMQPGRRKLGYACLAMALVMMALGIHGTLRP